MKETENTAWLDCYCGKARQLRAAEDALGEYVSAIEEFGLDGPAAAKGPVRCRAGWLTPGEILSRAHTLARQVEQLTGEAAAARDQVLTHILAASTDFAEYQRLRKQYVDSIDDAC